MVQGPIADRVGLGVVTAGAAVVLFAFVVLARGLRPAWLRALDDLDAYPGPAGPSGVAAPNRDGGMPDVLDPPLRAG
jgi:hypothetical protein